MRVSDRDRAEEVYMRLMCTLSISIIKMDVSLHLSTNRWNRHCWSLTQHPPIWQPPCHPCLSLKTSPHCFSLVLIRHRKPFTVRVNHVCIIHTQLIIVCLCRHIYHWYWYCTLDSIANDCRYLTNVLSNIYHKLVNDHYYYQLSTIYIHINYFCIKQRIVLQK